MTVSSITSPASAPAYTTPTAAPSTPTGSAAQASIPTASTSVTLSALSQEADIVASLGSAGDTFQPYDATGLLNLVAQANTAAATPSAPGTPPSGQDGSAGNGANTSGTPAATALSGDWGTILKTNPGLTGTAVADAVAQGIVNTINVYA